MPDISLLDWQAQGNGPRQSSKIKAGCQSRLVFVLPSRLLPQMAVERCQR